MEENSKSLEDILCRWRRKLKNSYNSDDTICSEVCDYFDKRAMNTEPFDYMEWDVVNDGRITNPDWFEYEASLEELDKALVAYWRKSRFCEGQWRTLFSRKRSIAYIILDRLINDIRGIDDAILKKASSNAAHSQPPSTMTLDQAKGMLLGLAVGDALGTTLEFSRPKAGEPIHTDIIGEGPFKLPAGTFTDDTSMALAMATSLINKGEFQADDIMNEFNAWYRNGKHSPEGKCFDIGITTSKALIKGQQNPSTPYCGSVDKDSSGNGNIMRLAPIVIFNKGNYEDCLVDAVRQSMLTHASNECCKVAQSMAACLFHGSISEDIHGHDYTKPFKMDAENKPFSGGYIRETYSAACWAIRETTNFEDALVKVVNLGYDADTTGAVTGQLAGRIYGMSGIPERWLSTLLWKDKIESISRDLYLHNFQTQDLI